MAPRRLHFAVPRWQRLSGCAVALLAAGCGDAPLEPPSDVQQAAWIRAELLPRPTPKLTPLPRDASPAPVVLMQLPPANDAEAIDAPAAPLAAPSPAGAQVAEQGAIDSAPKGPQLLAPRELTVEGLPPAVDAWAKTYAQPSDEPVASPLTALLADATPVTTGEPTSAMVCQRAQDKIRRAYALAQRGAYFAARGVLIDALRTIADAKDQTQHGTGRAAMLANGLRALEEAGDFSPQGAEADAEVNIAVLVSSHRTPVGKPAEAAALMPQQVADLYLRYAQKQLGDAVSGEPAGSMALHALGKIYDQLGRLEPGKRPLADRRAFALQQAALVARSDNYLAAHELGVLLAESGHYGEAQVLLSQVAAREPNPVVLRNLAQVERKLGRIDAAVAVERQAQYYAARTGAPSPNGVSWVAPQALAQTSDGLPPARRTAAAPPQAGAPGPPHYRR